MLNRITTYRLIIPLALAAVILFTGCRYRKGDAYTWSGTADTVTYFIKARGRHLNDRISRLMWVHGNKRDDCRVIYLSDSARINTEPGILLFSSTLPDLKEDMLKKGFMGTFASRQVVTYLVVTRDEMDRFLKPQKKP